MFTKIFFINILYFIIATKNVYNFEDNSVTFAPEEISDDLVEETQHAICKINTEDIKTTANATIKRQLKGVCTTKQIKNEFKKLESRLLLELHQIKSLLTVNNNIKMQTPEYGDYSNFDVVLATKNLNNIESDDEIVSVTETVTQEVSWTRKEVERLNNTIYILKGNKVYTYYWKLPNIHQVLQKYGIHLKSPNFFVFGHQINILLFPNHLNSKYLGIQLQSVNFLKKFKFAILEQTDARKDIISQSFDGGSTEPYRIPYAKLQERHYLDNEAIFIKLIIYLSS